MRGHEIDRRPATGTPLVVETARAAALIAHPRRRRILFAFVDADRSLAEVAAMIEVPLNLLHYHVKRMVGAGLLQRREKRVRAGRPVQLYRAAASAFLVPAALMPDTPDAALQRELRQALDRQGADAYLFSREKNGRVRMSRAGASDASELWRVVRLDAASARELAADIGRLIESYEARSPKPRGTKPHLVHVAIVRRES